jgi:NAD+ kinase
MNVSLFGAEAEKLRSMIEATDGLDLVKKNPDVIVCYGGDGTLLTAELQWPNVPKVPIRNSRRGIRCIAEPPEEVVRQLAAGSLIRTEQLKLTCTVRHQQEDQPKHTLLAINEFSVHTARANSALRFKLWVNGKPMGDASDNELIGDGFVISTPFGSTAYFNQITRGVFWSGIGVAFMYTPEHTNHLIVPEDTEIVAEVTRGPATLAHDNSSNYVNLEEGDRITIKRHHEPAILFTTDD